MRMHHTVVVAASLSGLLSPVLAQQGQPQGDARGPATVLMFDHAGCASLFADAKDAGLKRALSMLPQRLRELPDDFPEMKDFPVQIIDLLVRELSTPGRLAITYNANDQSKGAFGVGVLFSIGPMDQNAAAEMHGAITAQLAAAGGNGDGPIQGEPRESKKYQGMVEYPSPVGGVIRFGPRQATDGWRYEAHLGAIPNPDEAFSGLAGPALPGLTPTFRAQMDLSSITPIVNMLAAMAGVQGPPEAQEMVGQVLAGLTEAGLIGPDAVRYTLQMGSTPTECVSIRVATGKRKFAAKTGTSTEPLPDSVFAIIPADATIATVSQISLAPFIGLIQQLSEAVPPVADGLEQFKQQTGVDVVTDVLGSLGDTNVFYMSDSTGGGLLSMTMLIALKDRATLERAHSQLVGFANTMLADSPARMARIRAWKSGDANLFSVTVAGLPIPLEPTWGLQGNWLVVSATPQGAVAATRQLAGKGGKGLLDNRSFAGSWPKGKQVTSFSFVDTARVMTDGYQYICLAGSAIGNLVRSSRDESHEPGLVVPTLPELRDGARPMLSYSYWRGDDLVSESHADRSMLVNLAGVAGAAAPFVPVIGAMIGGAALGAEGAREAAREAVRQYEKGADEVLLVR